jgi:hypothetical protein
VAGTDYAEVTGVRTASLEEDLAGIESRVLAEMWIGARRSAAYGLTSVILVLAALMWWHDVASYVAVRGSNRVPLVGLVALMIAATMSAWALWSRRFRACCVAACTCGLATVVGVGGFWWLHTGRPAAPSSWLLVADVAVAILTIGWLSVVLTPLERSQPQMRAYRDGTAR